MPTEHLKAEQSMVQVGGMKNIWIFTNDVAKHNYWLKIFKNASIALNQYFCYYSTRKPKGRCIA